MDFPLENYKPGEKDPCGNKIRKIFSRTDTYVIYATSDRQDPVLYYTTDPAQEKRAAELALTAALIKQSAPQRYRKHRQDLACALKAALDGNTQAAMSALSELSHQIEVNREYDAKINYWKGFVLVLVPFGLLLILFYLLTDSWSNATQQVHLRHMFIYLGAGFIAALGGLLSVSMSIFMKKNERIQPNLDFRMYLFNGLLKMIISTFAGIGITILCLSQMLFGNIDFRLDPSTGSYTNAQFIYFTAFIAGFSERFLPNLIQRYEQELSASQESLPEAEATAATGAEEKPPTT